MSDVVQPEKVLVRQEQDVVLVRQAVRRICLELKFSLVDQTKMVTAASELARNLLIYGGGGEVLLEIVEMNGRRGLCTRFHDEGPGIADLTLAMKDGYTTGQGLGLGLSGARRLVNEFHIDSAPGKGTRIAATRWK